MVRVVLVQTDSIVQADKNVVWDVGDIEDDDTDNFLV